MQFGAWHKRKLGFPNPMSALPLLAGLVAGQEIEFSMTALPENTDEPSTVPEPGTLTLFGPGLLGFGAARRRKQRKV